MIKLSNFHYTVKHENGTPYPILLYEMEHLSSVMEQQNQEQKQKLQWRRDGLQDPKVDMPLHYYIF